MESRIIFLVFGLLAAGAVFAEAYTWTDEEGVVHFSDRPHPGAEEIQLPDDSTSQPRPTLRRSTDNNEEDATSTTAFSYTSLEVASPGSEETLWNIEGVLSVSLNLQPALRTGHRVRVYFDGTPRMVNGTRFEIEEVYRGAHNLQAEIVDETGQLLIRSLPRRFYVQQTSVL